MHFPASEQEKRYNREKGKARLQKMPMFEILGKKKNKNQKKPVYVCTANCDVVGLVDAMTGAPNPIYINNIYVQYTNKEKKKVSKPVKLENFDIVFEKYKFKIWFFEVTYNDERSAFKFSNGDINAGTASRLEIIPRTGDDNLILDMIAAMNEYYEPSVPVDNYDYSNDFVDYEADNSYQTYQEDEYQNDIYQQEYQEQNQNYQNLDNDNTAYRYEQSSYDDMTGNTQSYPADNIYSNASYESDSYLQDNDEYQNTQQENADEAFDKKKKGRKNKKNKNVDINGNIQNGEPIEAVKDKSTSLTVFAIIEIISIIGIIFGIVGLVKARSAKAKLDEGDSQAAVFGFKSSRNWLIVGIIFVILLYLLIAAVVFCLTTGIINIVS